MNEYMLCCGFSLALSQTLEKIHMGESFGVATKFEK